MATVQSIDGIVTNLISQTEDPNNLRRVSKGKLKIQRVSRIGNTNEALESYPAIPEVEVDLSHVTGEDINEEDLMRELDETRMERTFSIDEELNAELGGGLFDDIDIESPPPVEPNPPPDPPVIEESGGPEATVTIDQSEEIKAQMTADAMAHVEEEIARRQQEADTLAQSALVSTSRGLQPISKLTPSELEEHHAEIVEKKLVTESQYSELLQITEETAKLKSRLAAEKEMRQNIGAAKQNISAAKEMFATMSKEAESQRAAAAAAAAAQPTQRRRSSGATRQVKIDPIVLDDHEKVIRDISTEPTGFNVDSFVTYMTSRMGQVLIEHLHGFFMTLQPNEEGIVSLEKFKELIEGADLVYAFKHWLDESRSEQKESDHTEISGSKIVSGFAGLESQPSRKIVTVDEEHKEKVLQAKLVTDSKYAAALQSQNKEINRVNAQDEIGGTSLVKNSIWLQSSATETQTTTPRRKRKKKKSSAADGPAASPSPDAQG